MNSAIMLAIAIISSIALLVMLLRMSRQKNQSSKITKIKKDDMIFNPRGKITQPIKKEKKNTFFAVIIIFVAIISVLLFFVMDVDGDGLSNFTEIRMGTSMFNFDSDYDGLSDGDELNTYGTDPLKSDSDNDGLNDYKELQTYQTNPLDDDQDNDGLNDGDEVRLGTDLFNTDSDDDGILDGADSNPTTHEWKLMDSDGDGWSDYKEYYEKSTDRFDSDTDDDGYKDSIDAHPTTHEWKLMDSDGDGWSDYKEYYETGTSKSSSDTDSDGAPDPRDANPLNPSYDITINFEWDYPHDWWNKRTWKWSLSLSHDLYDYMSQFPRTSSYDDWSEYTVDPLVSSLATGLKEAAENEGYDSYQTVSFILSFVQSLPYTEDDVTTGADDYPRYPIETLVDGGGDCEDTSFLFAGIIKELNYGVCLVNPPGHVAVGILGSETLPGIYYELDGKRYYYCETTGSGWEIGDCPDEYLNKEAVLIEL